MAYIEYLEALRSLEGNMGEIVPLLDADQVGILRSTTYPFHLRFMDMDQAIIIAIAIPDLVPITNTMALYLIQNEMVQRKYMLN